MGGGGNVPQQNVHPVRTWSVFFGERGRIDEGCWVGRQRPTAQQVVSNCNLKQCTVTTCLGALAGFSKRVTKINKMSTRRREGWQCFKGKKLTRQSLHTGKELSFTEMQEQMQRFIAEYSFRNLPPRLATPALPLLVTPFEGPAKIL